MPEIAARHHLEADRRGDRARAARSRLRSGRRRARRGDARARADRRAARRPLGREGDRRRAASCRSRRSTISRGHVAANFLQAAGGPFEPPFLCLVASGGHTLVAEVDAASAPDACSARRSTMQRARRSTRARGCSGSAIPAARRSSALAADGDPLAFAFPGSAAARHGRSRRSALDGSLDFSFAGLKTALLYRLRDLGEAEAAAQRAPDLAASYQRGDRRQPAAIAASARWPHGACGRLAVGGGVAANGALRRRLGAARRRSRTCRRASCARTMRR